MVTLDLYGRQRLNALSAKFTSFHNSHPYDITSFIRAMMLNRIFNGVVFILFILTLYFGLKAKNSILKIRHWSFIPFAFLMSPFFFIIWVTFFAIMLNLFNMTFVVSSFLNKFTAEGSLLIVGTILFLVSRLLAYSNIDNEE